MTVHKINFTPLDEAITRLIAKLPKSFRPFFVAMSYVGHPVTISTTAGLMAAFGVIASMPTLILSGIGIWATMLVSTTLKNLTKRSRPLTDYVAGMRIRSYSFPSGHTTGSTVTFGLFSYYALQFLPAPIGFVALAIFTLALISVGISRVYLGAHFPTDVIGGWVLGAAGLSTTLLVVGSL